MNTFKENSNFFFLSKLAYKKFQDIEAKIPPTSPPKPSYLIEFPFLI